MQMCAPCSRKPFIEMADDQGMPEVVGDVRTLAFFRQQSGGQSLFKQVKYGVFRFCILQGDFGGRKCGGPSTLSPRQRSPPPGKGLRPLHSCFPPQGCRTVFIACRILRSTGNSCHVEKLIKFEGTTEYSG